MKPRLLFVGSHLARHPGWVTTQGEVLAGLFRREGYEVRETSHVLQPLLRALDVARSLWRWRSETDLAIVSVFSGRAFRLAGLASWLLARLGVPQVLWLHGGGLPELIRRRPGRVRRVLRRAEVIVAPSGWLADEVATLGFEVTVIPNVLDLSRYEYLLRTEPETPLRLLWMRTFHEIYRPLLAIETLARLHDAGVDARLTLAGQERDGPLLEACRRRARGLGLAERIRFAGFLDMDGKRRAFSEHDVFLNTNAVDNTPVTVLEAMASGLPVVATAVGGVPHLLRHGEAGVLVPPDDAEAMAEALRELVAEGSADVERLSAAGRAVAEACDWPAVHRRWWELFGRLELPGM